MNISAYSRNNKDPVFLEQSEGVFMALGDIVKDLASILSKVRIHDKILSGGNKGLT